MATTHSLETIRSAFDAFFPGAPVLRVAQNLGGHINQTYFVETTRRKDGCRLFVLQCLNKHVFPDVLGLMDNVMRISEHLEKKSLADPAADRKRDHLHYLHTADGRLGVDAAAGFWRLYRFIPHAEGRLQAESPAEARAAAAAFGRFQALLADMPPPRLVETIPAFHDTRRRYEALECAFIENRAGRADEPEARELLDGFRALRPLALSVQESFERGEMPERITHNDAKYSNILVDPDDGHPVCVIDLDTCMPGLSLHDFGDLMRSMCAEAPEDEPDVSKIRARPEMYEALADGFLAEAGGVLTPAEKRLLPNGGAVMTLEVGVRFLTDYVEGDHYFRVAQPRHNLIRARSQLALARSMAAVLPMG
ncbi:MAG: phosphotransferase [Kiritimatiellae bacterium]|nr:phosphotransferase [Kiritimatiellia bacterium]